MIDTKRFFPDLLLNASDTGRFFPDRVLDTINTGKIFPDQLLGVIDTGGISELAPERDQHQEIFQSV